jgi:hypothetical protein
MDLIGCEDYEGNYFVVKEASVDQLKGCFFFFFFFFFFYLLVLVRVVITMHKVKSGDQIRHLKRQPFTEPSLLLSIDDAHP